MGIYIKGMKMPKNCSSEYCPLLLRECKLFTESPRFILGEERHPDCPLVSVPDHGDLVDIDNVLEDFAELSDYDFALRGYVLIPAERSEE